MNMTRQVVWYIYDVSYHDKDGKLQTEHIERLTPYPRRLLYSDFDNKSHGKPLVTETTRTERRQCTLEQFISISQKI